MMARRFGLWIDGAYRITESVEAIFNPYTGEVFAEACLAGEREIDQAICAAVKAFASFRSLSRGRRAELLRGIAEEIRRNREELATWIVRETDRRL
jgi:acyl-CoA reductase-like NAD-dependent aldehyde dehydrogenase